MIIWSGWGILIILVGIFGLLFGGLLGGAMGAPGAGLGIGFLLAALANFGLWKMIYPKEPRVLIDPATGQHVIQQPNHRLFFIPARAWTWIFLVLAIPMMFAGIAADKESAAEEATPGHQEFTTANNLIDSKSSGLSHGNSPAAQQSAAVFCENIKTVCEAAFSGGSNRNLMTGGNFLTYCQEGSDTLVFLCHVPELRNYKADDSKDALAEIAWTVASGCAEKLDPEKKKKLIVGLRGVASYGIVLEGQTGGALPDRSSMPDKATVFYPAFVASQPAP